VLIALLRARVHPYFATPQTYEVLNAIPLSHTIVISGTILLSVLTLVVATYLMRLFETPKEAYIILLLSPPVLAAAILNPFALLLALAAALALLYKDSYKATIPILIACYMHPTAGILAAALALYQAHTSRYKPALLTLVASATLAILSPSQVIFATQFAELQAPGAISIISVLLGILGAILLWDENTSIPLLIACIPLLAGLIFSELALVTAIVSAVLAGNALRILRKREWQLKAVKTATTYFIILGLIFAATASTSQAVIAKPHAEILETAELMIQLTEQEVSVLSTQQGVLEWYGVPTQNANVLYLAKTSDDIKDIANTYILIEDDYRAPKLRFLLENSNSYIQVRDAEHDVWRITQ
jgi:hypothetical protein